MMFMHFHTLAFVTLVLLANYVDVQCLSRMENFPLPNLSKQFHTGWFPCSNDGRNLSLCSSALTLCLRTSIGRVLTTTEKTEVLKAFGGDKKVFILPDQFVKVCVVVTLNL